VAAAAASGHSRKRRADGAPAATNKRAHQKGTVVP
jgi:hypothetical protein